MRSLSKLQWLTQIYTIDWHMDMRRVVGCETLVDPVSGD